MSKNVLEQETSQPTELVGPDFMSDGGEMGALMRAHDWSSSSLGPPPNWSQSLRTVVRVMLNTGHPKSRWWLPIQRRVSSVDWPRKAPRILGTARARGLARDMGHHRPANRTGNVWRRSDVARRSPGPHGLDAKGFAVADSTAKSGDYEGPEWPDKNWKKPEVTALSTGRCAKPLFVGLALRMASGLTESRRHRPRDRTA
jgi:hypothetical protein